MTAQLDLFATAAPESDKDTAPPWFERMVHYITQGKPVEFTLSMTVCELHQLWDDLWHRSHYISERLERFAGQCEARRQSATSNHEKRRLRQLSNRATEMAHTAESIGDWLYSSAQEEFHQALPFKDDPDASDAFWMDVSHRPGIEYTWNMTLQQVISELHKA